jgi:hypothetical protein
LKAYGNSRRGSTTRSRVSRSPLEFYASSPRSAAHRAPSREGWSQKWLHGFENCAICAHSSAYAALEGMAWAQGAAGSNPAAPTTFRTPG